jgi:hypothetical protein
MPKRTQRIEQIQPRVEPIKGPVGAGPAPGDRGLTEQPGEGNDGRRSDASAHHLGKAVADVIGGGPVKRDYQRVKY